jgi:hypothetical protein
MTKPNLNQPPPEKPNKQLQAWLRQRIADQGLIATAREMRSGPDAVRSYLADLRLRVSTFRGIEATLTMLAKATPTNGHATNGHAQEAQTANGASRR